MYKNINGLKELLDSCTRGNRMTYLKSMNRLYNFKPRYHKGIPQCQEVVQYRPQLLKLTTVLGPDNPAVMLQSADPATGGRTLEICRLRPLADDLAELLISCHSRALMNLMDFEGDKMPIALCIGGNPVYYAVAGASLPSYVDPLFFAGIIDCAAVKVVRCLTQELFVPDDCDFVLEGYITKKSLDNAVLPVMHITGVTHRKGAMELYLERSGNGVGDFKGREGREGKGTIMEDLQLELLRLTADRDIIDLYLPPYGNGTDLAVIKIRRRYPWHAAKVAHALWGSNRFMFNKVLLVVDENTTDIRSNAQLSRAICSNYNPKSDTLFSRGPADVTDKSTPVKGFGGKICIDATVKSTVNQTDQSSIQKDKDGDLSGSGKAIEFIHKGDVLPPESPVIVVVGNEMDINDTAACLHYVIKNADPIRDSSYVGKQLVIEIS